jgi:hypothetical protein
MPLVFIFVALLFWATVATVVALGRLSRDTFRWFASLGHHGSRGALPAGQRGPHS